jgi:glycosyltransferase involved in cell wall biosynthesis
VSTTGRKVLFVTYRFPPQSGGGAQRTLKFAKYLREFGWEPVVHTVRNPYWPLWDESLLADVPADLRVYRTRTFEFERLESRLVGLLARPGDPPKAERHASAEAGGTPRTGRRGWLGAVRAAVHRYLLVPDPQIAWLPGAFVRGLAIARRERVDLVFTSSPPNSIHLVGALLAAALRKPWVADFRDPWTDGVRRQQAYVRNRPRAALEQAAERAVLRRADHAVVSAEPLRGRFLTKYGFLASDRVTVLTNGFDPADFAACQAPGRELEPGRFHLTGTGNIESMFDLRPMLRAVAELVAEDADLRADLVVNLVGTRKGKYDADLQALGLAERIRYIGWVPKSQSLRYLHQSDVLFMVALTPESGSQEKFPAKSFEYLYLRKPILCLSHPGATMDFLSQSGLLTAVRPDDVAGIKAALRTLYARRTDPSRGDAAFIARFDRRRLTGRLASIFDQLVGEPGAVTAAA